MVSVGAYLVLTHFAALFLGFALGGFVAYKLVMRKMKSRVTSMFDFDGADDLIDSITSVEGDESFD